MGLTPPSLQHTSCPVGVMSGIGSNHVQRAYYFVRGLHNTTQHRIPQDSTTQHSTAQHNAMQHNTTQHHITPQYYTTLHNATQRNATQQTATQYINDLKHLLHHLEADGKDVQMEVEVGYGIRGRMRTTVGGRDRTTILFVSSCL